MLISDDFSRYDGGMTMTMTMTMLKQTRKGKKGVATTLDYNRGKTSVTMQSATDTGRMRLVMMGNERTKVVIVIPLPELMVYV
jgi:hypothetical protein